MLLNYFTSITNIKYNIMVLVETRVNIDHTSNKYHGYVWSNDVKPRNIIKAIITEGIPHVLI